jgi:hypothetical protein
MTRTAIAVLAALILAPASAAAADNLAGQASVIDGDTLEIHATPSGYGVSTLRKAVSFAEARIASSIGAAQRRRTIWTPSLQGGR